MVPNSFSLAPRCILVLLASALPWLARAEYHNFNTQSGSDAIVQDVRWPYWAESTYNAIYSQTLSGLDGGSCYFYGGMPSDPGGNPPCSIIWSFWPPSGTAVPGAAVTAYWTATNMYAPPHVGEGASGKAAGPWSLIQSNRWYREVLRVWRPVDGTPHLGFSGRWLRDSATGNWYHIATMKIPFSATGIDKLSGFQEDFGHGNINPRRTDYRNVYYHKNGVWTMANQFTPSVRQLGENGTCGLIENATAAFFETCSSSSYLTGVTNNMPPTTGNLVMLIATNWASSGFATSPPPGVTPVAAVNNYAQYTFTIANQPVSPPIDPILVSTSSASAYGNQLVVRWQLPATSSPQFAYKVEVFNNPGYTGTPAVSFYDIDPEARQKLLDIGGVGTPYARLTIIDVFDVTNSPILLTPATVALNVPTAPATTAPGLGYKYYEGTWTSMPNFTLLAPVYQGAVDYPDLTLRRRRSSYGFSYTGLVQAPADGLYAFTVLSCDGAKLYVDGALVVSHDGIHSPSGLSGWAALAAGKHAVEVQYFFNAQNSNAGDLTDQITVSWEGPGFSNVEVSPSAWFRVPSGAEPGITLTAPADGVSLANSNVTLAASVATNGVTVNKVQFYVGDYYWGQDSNAPFPLSSLFWAAPSNAVRARLFYNTSYTLDSAQSLVTTTNMALAPWLLAGASEHVKPFGAKIESSSYSLIGDGLNLLCRQVDGDCTLIARVAGIPSTAAAPDGTTPDSSWEAGIIMRESTNSTPGTPLGNGSDSQYAAVFATVNNDTHFQDNTMANAGGPYWSGGLGGQRWLKLQRAGSVFTTSVSTDGANWTPVNTNTLTSIATRLYVGLFTYAASSQNPNVHWATFDSVSLTGTIVGPPDVSVSPLSETAYPGQNATFTALPSGNPPFTYQWQLNGVSIPGATGVSLSLTNLQPTNSGLYRVALTSGSGSVTSGVATLTVRTPPAYCAQALAAGPLAYWRLNDAGPIAADSVGSFDGTGQGGVVFGAAGVGAPFTGFEPGNAAAQFNGTDSSVAIPALNLNTTNFTISGWVKRNGTQTSWSGIIFCRSGGTVAGLHFGTANELRYTWNDAGNTYNWNSGLTVPDGQWTFVALTIEPTRAIMYRGTNSILRATTNSVTHAGQTFPGTTYLGYDPNQASRRLNGTLDEVALFNRTLSGADLGVLFNAALTNLPTVSITSPADGESFPLGTNLQLVASITTNGHAINRVQFFNGPTLLGEFTSAPYSLTLSNVDSGAYTLIAQAVYDGGSVVSSVPVNVSVNPPVSVSSPQSVTNYAGRTASFSVTASGTPPYGYQWQLSGADLPGATSPTLTLPSIQPADGGPYRVVVSDPYSATTSSVAMLTVIPVMAGSYLEAVVTNNPVAYWRLGELSGTRAYDYIGGYHGTYTGVTLNQAGAVLPDSNRSAYFNGSSSWVGSGVSLGNNRSAFTMEGWFKLNAAPAKMGFWGQNDTIEFGLISANTLQIWTPGGGSLNVTYSWGQGTWHHLVAVGNGADLRMYVDGNLVGTGGSATSSYGSSAYPFNIGGGGIWDATGNWFGGWIDDVAFYDKALSAAEIKRHYLLGLALPAVTLSSPANGATFVPPATISLAASVTANGHTVTNVQFFNGAALLGSDSTAPYIFTWNNVGPGAASLSAVAVYDSGSVTSSVANVTIWDPTPPLLSPAVSVAGGAFNFQFGGTVGQHYRVEFVPSLPATGQWQVLTDIASLVFSPFPVSDAATGASRFYRVVSVR